MHISHPLLQRLLGGLWLIDGLIQLQPRMYTMDMVHSVTIPMLQSQPGLIGTNLQWIVQQTALHLAAVNLLITVVQISLGLLFFSNHWVKGIVVASIVWALIVWYAGEDLSILLTGQSSILTGALGQSCSTRCSA